LASSNPCSNDSAAPASSSSSSGANANFRVPLSASRAASSGCRLLLSAAGLAQASVEQPALGERIEAGRTIIIQGAEATQEADEASVDGAIVGRILGRDLAAD